MRKSSSEETFGKCPNFKMHGQIYLSKNSIKSLFFPLLHFLKLQPVGAVLTILTPREVLNFSRNFSLIHFKVLFVARSRPRGTPGPGFLIRMFSFFHPMEFLYWQCFFDCGCSTISRAFNLTTKSALENIARTTVHECRRVRMVVIIQSVLIN